MGTSAATAWRMARRPLWAKVPSPRLANTCFSWVKGCWPSQWMPSAPMWEGALVVLGFTRMAMVWQPMPARARLPSGTRVERLCGQPEQKPGLRAGRPGAGP